MITAFDNQGNVYFTLSYANTDKQTFNLFLSELCRQLDLEEVSWRKSSVLLLDGASYHINNYVK